VNIRDRIKELRRVPADQLQPNPKNWRKHPEAQANALRGVLAEVGIASAVLARETPEGGLMLIDGHLRTETLHNAEIPVLVLDVTEEEADKILATFDPLGAMAESDADALRALLEDVETGSRELADMLTALAEDAGILDGEDAAEGEDSPTPKLADRFGVAPFSVLNARDGWWQERKRAWLALGITSEQGRGKNTLGFSDVTWLWEEGATTKQSNLPKHLTPREILPEPRPGHQYSIPCFANWRTHGLALVVGR
jgi:hypothetical protein